MTKLTEAKFAQLCAYIATNAAKWAGDMLTLPEDHNQPVDAKTVKRFTDEMRARLDRLDEMAGSVIKAAGEHVDEKDPSTPRAALDAIKTGLRLPPDLRKKIKKAAKLNDRSANSEILVALYTAFPASLKSRSASSAWHAATTDIATRSSTPAGTIGTPPLLPRRARLITATTPRIGSSPAIGPKRIRFMAMAKL